MLKMTSLPSILVNFCAIRLILSVHKTRVWLVKRIAAKCNSSFFPHLKSFFLALLGETKMILKLLETFLQK